MKLSDYVVHYLADLGIKHVFVVTGGFVVNLIDSLHNEPRLKHICVNHEQIAGMAGEAYARLNGLSAIMTTNAPGALNLLNSISGAWNDSIPCIFICGQVTRKTWNRSTDPSPSEYDDREIVDIVTIVKSITKSADYVEDPLKIKYYLDKAVHTAKEGRPGPVLIDIPLDVQKVDIPAAKLIGYQPKSTKRLVPKYKTKVQVTEAWRLIKLSKRPVLLLGGGVRLSNTATQSRQLVKRLGIPTVVTWCAFDILPHNHPDYLGSIGNYGNRRANYTIQNSDLILSLGAQLTVRQTGGDQKTFAPEATKISVDIENPQRTNVKIDLPIKCDLREFFDLISGLDLRRLDINPWRKRLNYYRSSFPDVLPEYYAQKYSVNVYVFMKKLSEMVPAEIPVLTDCGGNLIWTMQAYETKDGQRVFSNMGLSSMGYSLGASIGACLANDKKSVICLIGDGGLQVHIQELQTVKYHNLPIKIFVINNRSYGIIKQTIESWTPEAKLHGNIAVSEDNGYSCPDFVKIAQAYDLKTVRISNNDEIIDKVAEVLNHPGPVLCDVLIDENQRINPRLEFGRPLEDQHPLIDREDLKKIMIIGNSRKNRDEEITGI